MNKCYSPQFKIITTLVCLSAGVTFCDVTGVKDTSFKIWACYLAAKLTNANHRTIAEFFNIYPAFMKNQLENLAISFLLDTDALKYMEGIEDAYKQITKIKDNV